MFFRRLSLTGISGILLVTAVLTAVPAYSFGSCCGVCGRAAQLAGQSDRNTVKGTREIQKRIDEMEQAIVKALKEQTSEQSAHDDREVESKKRIADAKEQNETVRERQRRRADAETQGRHDPDPVSCLAVGLAVGSGGGGGGGPYESNAGDILAGDTPEGGDGVARDRRSYDEKKQFEGMGGVKDPTSDWEALLGANSVDYSKEGLGPAFDRLIVNTVDPRPAEKLDEERLSQSPSGLALIAENQATLARQSLAKESGLFAMRLRAQIASSKGLVPYADRSLYDQQGREIPERISELQALDILTVFHHAPNAEEAGERATVLTEKNLLERIYQVSALQARMDYLQLEHGNRELLLLSGILGVLTPQREELPRAE